MADFQSFAALVADSTDSSWLVRFDLPGFGTSPAPRKPIGSHEYAEIVGDAIGQVVASMPSPSEVKVFVIGHSFGGRIALSLTSLSLTAFTLSAILLSGVPLLRNSASVRRPKMSFRIAKLLAGNGLISKTRMEALRVRYGSRDYAAATGVMRDVLVKVVNEDYSKLLENLSVPVLLFWGTEDTTAPLVVAEKAVGKCPSHITLQSMPGDHFLAVTFPKMLLDAVEDLVQRTRD